MNKLYIIPGLGESSRSKNYRGIIKGAKNIGYEIVPINISWSGDLDMNDFIKEAQMKLPQDISKDCVLGFSFGSYIAYQISQKRKAGCYIFCSTSPYFSSDLKKIPKKSREYFGEKLFKSFKRYNLVKNIETSGIFLVGNQDWILAQDRTKILYKNWRGDKKIKIIPSVDHNLSHLIYEKEILSLLKEVTLNQIKEEFKIRFERDQKARADLNWPEIKKLDKENTTYLKIIVKNFGWPTISQFGTESSKMAWVLLQHSPDLVFQKKCLKLMKSLDIKEADQILIAYLEDRTSIRQKKKQIYGTQFSMDGKMRPVIKPKELDTRRKMIGLMPIKEYEKMIRKQKDRF